MRRSNRIGLLLIPLLAAVALVAAAEEQPGGRDYPVPQRDDRLLFFVQRTHNRNTVIYELNRLPDGTVNAKEPLHASWIRYEEGGTRKELSYVQTRVYGLDCKKIDADTWLLKFRQYRKREIYLTRNPKSNTYRALIRINGKMTELSNLFIMSVTNALGIPSSVRYIDISGIDPATGQAVRERVIP